MTNNARRSPWIWIHALLFGCLLVPTWASAQQVYRVTDIGMLDGAEEMGDCDINDSGQVAGTAFGDGSTRAFFWDGRALGNLDMLSGSETVCHAMNTVGQVTGWSRLAEDLERHGFPWGGVTLQDLGTLGSAPGGSRT